MDRLHDRLSQDGPVGGKHNFNLHNLYIHCEFDSLLVLGIVDVLGSQYLSRYRIMIRSWYFQIMMVTLDMFGEGACRISLTCGNTVALPSFASSRGVDCLAFCHPWGTQHLPHYACVTLVLRVQNNLYLWQVRIEPDQLLQDLSWADLSWSIDKPSHFPLWFQHMILSKSSSAKGPL